MVDGWLPYFVAAPAFFGFFAFIAIAVELVREWRAGERSAKMSRLYRELAEINTKYADSGDRNDEDQRRVEEILRQADALEKGT